MAQGGREQPSMEEILASIRRIISEDETAEGEGFRLSADERTEEEDDGLRSSAEQPREEEILDLTDRIERPGTEKVERGDASEPAGAAEALPEEPPAPAEEGKGDLLSSDAAAAAVAALSQAVQLGDAARAGAAPTAGSGSQTLDALVRQALTPLLKAWLDENLPPLVERIVREEVRRLAEQAGSRPMS